MDPMVPRIRYVFLNVVDADVQISDPSLDAVHSANQCGVFFKSINVSHGVDFLEFFLDTGVVPLTEGCINTMVCCARTGKLPQLCHPVVVITFVVEFTVHFSGPSEEQDPRWGVRG